MFIFYTAGRFDIGKTVAHPSYGIGTWPPVFKKRIRMNNCSLKFVFPVKVRCNHCLQISVGQNVLPRINLGVTWRQSKYIKWEHLGLARPETGTLYQNITAGSLIFHNSYTYHKIVAEHLVTPPILDWIKGLTEAYLFNFNLRQSKSV